MKRIVVCLMFVLAFALPVVFAEDDAADDSAPPSNFDQLLSRFNQLETDYAELQSAYLKEQDEKNTLAEELAGIRLTAANALAIANERNELRQQVTELLREIADLKQINRDYENDRSQRWFLFGALVLIAGIILGIVAPNIRLGQRQNKNANWNRL